MSGISSIKIKNKIVLILITFLVPITMLGYILNYHLNKDIYFNEQEKLGVKYSPLLFELLDDASHMLNKMIYKLPYDEESARVKKGLEELNAIPSKDIILLELDDKVLSEINKPNISPKALAERFSMVSKLNDSQFVISVVSDIRDLILYITYKSNLALDSDLDTYLLMSAIYTSSTSMYNRLNSIMSEIEKNNDSGIALEMSVMTEVDFMNLRANLKDSVIENKSETGKHTPELEKFVSLNLEDISDRIDAFARSSKISINDSSDIIKRISALADSLLKFNKEGLKILNQMLDIRIDGLNETKMNTIIMCSLLLSASLVLFVMISKNITSPINKIMEEMGKISRGECTFEIDNLKRGDELGSIARNLDQVKNFVKKVFLDDSKKNSEILDNLSIAVMLCDGERNIKYCNKSFFNLLKIISQGQSMNISPDNCIDKKIDLISQDLCGQFAEVMSTNVASKKEIQIGREWILSCINPIKNSSGAIDAIFFDWILITKEFVERKNVLMAQDKIKEIISNAQSGVLDKRLNSSEFDGFYQVLAESFNQLFEAVHIPISKCIEILTHVSGGDLTMKMDGDFMGSFANMQSSINDHIDSLRNTMIKIQENVISVEESSKEIAEGSGDLARRTESQAASLEETASSMEQITETVKESNKNTSEANNLVNAAKDHAENGNEVIYDTSEAMHNIEEFSKKIVDIINVIDEIAFQTNLLALNAAVEAARAGEAGKGFAVVAAEVRNLASRSSTASKEIKSLITESDNQVKNGSTLMIKAGDALIKIVGSVTQVASIIGDIASASNSQTGMIEEINAAISHMDQTTQQNAALVEENNAATLSLMNMSKELKELVSFFRV